jgi:hypothetical protein
MRDGERGNTPGREAARALVRAAGRREQIASPESQVLAAAELGGPSAEQRAGFACAFCAQPGGEMVAIAHGRHRQPFAHLTACERRS